MEIRSERPDEIQEIHRLTTDAFALMPFSDGSEPVIIDKLRASGDLTLSLVALQDGVLAGHVAFSPVKIGSDMNGWYGLGPISVWPGLQRKGIGSSLIREGFRILREMNAEGCALVGDPKYYCRFGFKSDGKLHHENVPDKNVQWTTFGEQHPSGQLFFHPAFGV